MTRRLISFVAATLCLCLASCVKEPFSGRTSGMDGEGLLELRFGSTSNIEISTKATVSESSENSIYNFYLFAFDADGNKTMGTFFSPDNQVSSEEEVKTSDSVCWYVKAASGSTAASGILRTKIAAGENIRIYMVANLDADMVKISSDLLAHGINREEDLKNFTVFLNQRIVNRNGYFPMSGSMDGVTITAGGRNSVSGKLALKRLDAKVRFIFKTGTRPDANGQKITKFTASQWKVVNVPRTAYLFPCGHDSADVPKDSQVSGYPEYAENFFDTNFVNFEDFPSSSQSEFSFYMLENRQTPKKTPLSYQDRSRDSKLADGTNGKCSVTYVVDGTEETRQMRLFEYANDFSTYVVVKGEVEMQLDGDDAGQVLGADVQYIIHLGDWSAGIDNSDGNKGEGKDTYKGYDNFNTERNTSYTYTVTVNSVHNIRVEVETSQSDVSDVKENQPGASGSVVIAKEEIASCDSHYESKTITFHLKSFFAGGDTSDPAKCLADKLTWRVVTPFSEGSPETWGGIDILHHLDYKWIHFRLNKKDSDGNWFSDKRRKYSPREFRTSEEWRDSKVNLEDDGTEGLAGYHNDGCMDIIQLVSYIKEQVARHNSGQTNDFDKGDTDGPKICLTAFVDEYYYDAHPLTGATSPTLWKRFVNQDDRKLHILSDSETSKDRESDATGSVVTILQRSIKSIYNTDPSYTALQTAWGVESTDEYDGKWKYWSTRDQENRGNGSGSNGLLNTAKEWGLVEPDGKTFKTGEKWTTYLDQEVDNSTPVLKDDYAYLRYACMSRNRDNNGNGIIDRNEVRWYMASIRQLVGMYIGNGLLSSDVQLYNKTPEQQQSDVLADWQQHVISSTRYGSNSNNPTMVWAEEGISTGEAYPGWANLNDPTKFVTATTVRCVRNLGSIGGISDETYSLGQEPEDFIQMEGGGAGKKENVIFTATHLNGNALRYYTSRELPMSDERGVENRLYKKFEVYKDNTGTVASYGFQAFNRLVDDNIAAGKGNPACPEGYRLPNQVELAIMYYYMEHNKPGTVWTRTYWSFGALGKNDKGQKDSGTGNYSYGFGTNDGHMTAYEKGKSEARCVRDIRVN